MQDNKSLAELTEELGKAIEKVDTAHYDCFNMDISATEAANGVVRLDPYKVSDTWELGKKDPSGCLFHMLKTMSRFGVKEGNSVERELASLQATLTRLTELYQSKNSIDKNC